MDYNLTADALERMAVQQQAMADAAAAFRSLGSIEGAAKEANARKDAAVTAATVEIERLNKTMQQQADVEQKIAAALEAASDNAESIRMAAAADADQITSRAQLNALQITNDAKEAADKMIVRTENDLAEKQEAAASLTVAMQTARDELATMVAAADAAEARLADARAMLAKLAAG